MVRHSLPATKVDTSAYIPETVRPLSFSHSPLSRTIPSHPAASHRIASHTILPSWRARPDILTNNFIDALFRAVCVWFLIAAQLCWTHVIIAHFMTHLSKTISRSRPWHCPLSAQPSQLLIFCITLCLTAGREHSSVSSCLDCRSGSTFPHPSVSDQTVTRHLFGRDRSSPDCSFLLQDLANWNYSQADDARRTEGVLVWRFSLKKSFEFYFRFKSPDILDVFAKTFNMISFDLFFGLSPYQ